ncbi:hypothetical protein B0J13DRAFT_140058 [Dactylonectria estremocensis]|uniref:Uncharacterized protein n=1 Tax=Dactylonectria estremocensis TaxID=1079267 RepID=A0A9P9IRB4_9HYPO|nr:hypothetical protein B0J13DRAFT_140058 [Dactylonectria estremocensis]
MSIVTSKFLRKHYNEALEDLECMSSAFWQVLLQQAFYMPGVYAVTTESPPDKSLRRVDLVVKRYDENHDTLSALLWVEFKRHTGSVKEVEQQALDAAKRCIQKDNLMWIWAMTTVGVSFRMWFISRDNLQLEPMHGTATKADKSQYINADSDEAIVFPEAVRRIKEGIPLRVAPVVPSQSLDLLTAGNVGQDASQYGYGYDYDYEMAEAGPSRVSGDGSDGNTGQYVEVTVEKITHTFSADDFVFRDAKGKKKTTKKEDWESGKYQGDKIWMFRGKKTVYFSRKKIA